MLPTPVLSQVLDYLPPYQILSARAVNHHWNNAALRCRRLPTFRIGETLNADQLTDLLGAPDYGHLIKLEIPQGKHVTDAVFQTILRNMTRLEALTVHNARGLTDAGITGLHPEMVKLILTKKSYLPLKNSSTMLPRLNGLNMKNQLPNLRYLDLKGCKRISDVSMKLAFDLPRLTEVNISFMINVTDVGLNWLCEQNPGLIKITAKHNRNITHFGLNFLLCRFPRIENIHITKEVGVRTLGELEYNHHPRFHNLVTVARWNEPV